MTLPGRKPLLQQHQDRMERIQSVVAQDTWVMGRILIEGTGEVTVEVVFPVVFTERPLPLLGGAELDRADLAKNDEYPTMTALVVDWHRDAGSGGPDHFVGATVAVRTTGRSGQRMYLTYAFAGSALTNIPRN